ncbi:MAG: ABC transporter ATP-binding protein [Candidatus Thorarchaeota archaeon]
MIFWRIKSFKKALTGFAIILNSPIIHIQNLSFCYPGSKISVLDNINLKFNRGEIVCISGSSGGGKTTLALTLAGHIPHTIAGELKGEVYLQDIPSSELSISEISQFVGLVQQDPENQLVTPSVYEEVAFGPENLALNKKEISNRLQHVLDAMDLSSIALRSTSELSGGEKQRVAVASILAMYPQVLILDEPTSFLDVPSIHRLILALRELNRIQNLTIILIEHKPYLFIDIVTRLIILEQGRITKDLRGYEVNYKDLMIPKDVLLDIQQIKTKESTRCLLKVQNLQVKVKNREILEKISLQLKKGLIYAVVGPNGAGKTTLLQSFLNLIPSNGNMLYLGKNTSEIPTYKLAKDFGLIFQNPNHQIFERTVLDEVMFAPRNFQQPLSTVKPKVQQLLKDANLDFYAEKTPFSLSYGEKRRLNICSILIYKPDLLLLDEPFIGQDRENVEYLLHLLKERKLKGGTTVIVSHRRELCDLVDYFYVLQKGKLVNQGTPDEMHPFLNENKILDSSIDVNTDAE